MLASDFKKGSTFSVDGKLFVVIDFQHVSRPRLAAMVRAKIKNIETGQVLEKNYKTSEKFDDIQVALKHMQYLYNMDGLYYVMDNETFETYPVDEDLMQNALNYIIENMTVTVKTVDGKIISVEPPLFVELKIVECDPAVAGDTAKSATKPAKLETGLTIKVPLFVNNEDTVRVDTRTGEYMERV